MNNYPIDKVIVLVMENQSFDHILGYIPNIGKLDDSQFAINRNGEKIYVRSDADPIKNSIFDPPHSHIDTLKQLYGDEKYIGQKPTGKGMLTTIFPKSNKNAEVEFMKCYNSTKHFPAITTLAKNFICCDRWFASVPGPTAPNRYFVHAATCEGYTGNSYIAKELNPPIKMKTIFESIDNKKNLDWRVYCCKNLNTIESLPYIKKNKHKVFPLDKFFSDIKDSKLIFMRLSEKIRNYGNKLYL